MVTGIGVVAALVKMLGIFPQEWSLNSPIDSTGKAGQAAGLLLAIPRRRPACRFWARSSGKTFERKKD